MIADRSRRRRTIITLVVVVALVPLGLAIRFTWRAMHTYRGVGDVVAVDPARLQVTINHDDIPGLMAAMTMSFPVTAAELLSGLAPGTRVRFDVLRQDRNLLVTQLTPIGTATGGRPGFHDHTPHHGGVVSMYGMTHLEVAATPEGRVRVYPSDVWRRPLPPAGWGGSVTLDLPDGKRTLALVAGDEALEAQGSPLGVAKVLAHVRIAPEGAAADDTIEMHVLLPLRPDVTGATFASVPECVPPASPAGEAGARLPRCAVSFPQPVSALATTPDGRSALVAVVSTWVTDWSLPAGELLHGLAPAPPTVVSPDHAPHGEAAHLIAVAPDGREAVVVLTERLLRYATTTGALLRELPGPGGTVRSVVWSPDGRSLLVSAYGDAAAHLIRAEDGFELRRLPVEQEAAGVAISRDGRLAAVGSETGPIAIFDLSTDRPPRLLREPQRPADNLVFVGDRLLSVAEDRVLRVWDARSGALVSQRPLAVLPSRLAVTPDGRFMATGDTDWAIRIHDLAAGTVVETLTWHSAVVSGLGWAGGILVSGDTEGRMALWDLADIAARDRGALLQHQGHQAHQEDSILGVLGGLGVAVSSAPRRSLSSVGSTANVRAVKSCCGTAIGASSRACG